MEGQKPKKVGGSAGLAALIKQRTEIVQHAQAAGRDPSVPTIVMASMEAGLLFLSLFLLSFFLFFFSFFFSFFLYFLYLLYFLSYFL
jgi:ABC-type multidrug transport system permease subunit